VRCERVRRGFEIAFQQPEFESLERQQLRLGVFRRRPA
jgi:hypothetical protein